MRLIAAALLAAVLFGGCSRNPQDQGAPPASAEPATSAAPAPEGPAFQRDAKLDAFGFYMPTSDVQVGSLKLSLSSVGTPDEFRDWEAGKREATHAPVMIIFDDVSSPMQSNEMGGETHTVTVRVLPTRYAVTEKGLSFAGQDPRLGEVTFAGAWDMAAIKAAQAGNAASDSPVLTGRLTAGGKTFERVQFTWFGGD